MDDVVVFLLTKAYSHVARLAADELNSRSVKTFPMCMQPERLSFLEIKSQSVENVIPDVESLRGKKIFIIGLDQSVCFWMENFIGQLKGLGFDTVNVIMYLDIPVISFKEKKYGYDFKAGWDSIFECTKNWGIAVNERQATVEALKEYTGKDPVFCFRWPMPFYPPTSVITGNYAIYCAEITRQKGQLEMIKLFAQIKDRPALYFIGAKDNQPDYWVKCLGVAKMFDVPMHIFEKVSEQEKYDLIAGSVFTVCGEDYEDCGSASPIEGFYRGKLACVWDNRTNREFFKEYALYAKDDSEFLDNIKTAMLVKPDFEKYRRFALSSNSYSVFAGKIIEYLKNEN